jgi:hypothetical protein
MSNRQSKPYAKKQRNKEPLPTRVASEKLRQSGYSVDKSVHEPSGHSTSIIKKT